MSQEISVPQPDPGPELDLAAAELRAERTDIHALVEALAAGLEAALPGVAAVKRRRTGGLRSRTTVVERIVLTLEEAQFELDASGGLPRCTRNRVVRGITLRREELPVGEWVAELVATVTRMATLGEQARRSLEALVR